MQKPYGGLVSATLEGVPAEIKQMILNYIATGTNIKEIYSNIIRSSRINKAWKKAIDSNFVSICKMIAQKFYGNNINEPDEQGITPLIRAVLNNDTAAIKILITAGANVNIADNSKSTALYYAAYNGNEAAVKLLINAGAKILKPTTSGWEESILGIMRMLKKKQAIIDLLEEAARDQGAR